MTAATASPPRWKREARSLLSPLIAAAVVTWAAVWAGVVGNVAARNPDLAWAARLVLLAFLAAFFVGHFAERAGRDRLCEAALAVQSACALGLPSLGPYGLSGVLLVIVAAGFAERYSTARAAGLVAGLNAVFAGIVHWGWGASLGTTATVVAAYGGFQAFAMITILYARKAERTAAELQSVNARLLATRSLLSETARDQERLRLSRELHDVAGHKLTALKINLRTLLREPSLAGRRELDVAAGLADELLDELRAVARQLRTGDGIDLADALARIAAPFPRPRVEVSVRPDARLPRAEQADVLVRAAQEAVTNAARHGAAANAWIRLSREDGHVTLVVEDDGRVRWPVTPGQGLTGMRERAEALGGDVSVGPSDAGGLKLAVRLPLEDGP